MMKTKFYFSTIMAFSLTFIILAFPAECLSYAGTGLELWFNRMIPTLFPFMVLSGIIIRMDLTKGFVKLIDPILGRLFQLNPACIYGMIVGFLCGFPMGAHVAAQLYDQKQITRREASLLTAFCNNIGPVYFLSFVLPILNRNQRLPYLFAMYGLPFCYGLFLRYGIYGNLISRKTVSVSRKTPMPFFQALDESVASALLGIARLGGYMVFFNLLFILPDLLGKMLSLNNSDQHLLTGAMGCLLEITGGIGILKGNAPLFVLCILPFGGFSCIAQTYSMIREAGLSIREYSMHKMILTAITVVYYLLYTRISILT